MPNPEPARRPSKDIPNRGQEMASKRLKETTAREILAQCAAYHRLISRIELHVKSASENGIQQFVVDGATQLDRARELIRNFVTNIASSIEEEITKKVARLEVDEPGKKSGQKR